MKNLISLFLIFTITVSYAQTETEAQKIVSAKIENHFNRGEYDSIFSTFSSNMQNALPLEKTVAFFTTLKLQAGQITKREFYKFVNPYATYKTNFERMLCSINIALDNNSKITGMFVKPFVETNQPTLQRNITKLILPFKDEWTVIWGGDTKELNYHVSHQAQKNAFDLVITDESGKSFRTDGRKNEDYYAFGKELIAPCDGEVVLVVDGIKDNAPGVMNPTYVPGNTVIIKTEKGEYLLFAHFKQQSILVKQGQNVKQGQLLGLCGNSGNSSEPHLHFHIQNIEDMNGATGAKCYFENIVVNGQVKSDYSPIQKEKIKNK
jgi:murein DD-endopeptidase MepM/ murein hydrolase activator NlpD